jgi:DNA-binding NarL/FixJ family response regulator
MGSVRLAVVDRYDLSRCGVRALVAHADPPMAVVGAFADLGSCETFLERHPVDVLLLDDDLPRHQDVAKAMRRLHAAHPGLLVIILTGKLNFTYLRRLLDQGANGIIYKEDRVQGTLVSGIQAVQRGEQWLSHQVLQLFLYRKTHQADLSQRDVDILKLLAGGYTVKQVGTHIGLSEKSVYRELMRLRERLEAHTNEHLIDRARQRGLLDS